MNKSAEYIEFEESFLKEAEAQGCDIPFLRGYIKEADEIVEIWKQAFDELAEQSGDPLYRYKLANEIIYASELIKQADDTTPNPAQYQPDNLPNPPEPFMNHLGRTTGMDGWQNSLEGWAGKNQGDGKGILGLLVQAMQKNPHLLTSLLSGGAGGGLLGLLLGGLMGHPMLGLMGGGLAGAMGSAYFNNQGIQDSVNNFFQPSKDTTAHTATVPKPAGPAAAAPAGIDFYNNPAGLPKPAGTADTAGIDFYNNPAGLTQTASPTDDAVPLKPNPAPAQATTPPPTGAPGTASPITPIKPPVTLPAKISVPGVK